MVGSPRSAAVVRAAIAFELMLALVAWLVGVLGGFTPWDALRFDVGHLALGIAATIPPLAGLALLTRSRWPPIQRLLREMEQTIAPLFRGCTMMDFVVIALAASLGEELLFRGAVQTWGVRVAGLPVGVLVASALFGLAHFITPTYALIAGAIGLYLGVLFAATGNLLVPVVVHALYDFLALAYWVRRRPPRQEGDGAVAEARPDDA
jgi:membrane protease YdiL (CAAX protease family)